MVRKIFKETSLLNNSPLSTVQRCGKQSLYSLVQCVEAAINLQVFAEDSCLHLQRGKHISDAKGQQKEWESNRASQAPQLQCAFPWWALCWEQSPYKRTFSKSQRMMFVWRRVVAIRKDLREFCKNVCNAHLLFCRSRKRLFAKKITWMKSRSPQVVSDKISKWHNALLNVNRQSLDWNTFVFQRKHKKIIHTICNFSNVGTTVSQFQPVWTHLRPGVTSTRRRCGNARLREVTTVFRPRGLDSYSTDVMTISKYPRRFSFARLNLANLCKVLEKKRNVVRWANERAVSEPWTRSRLSICVRTRF